jgi:hypothetical protein
MNATPKRIYYYFNFGHYLLSKLFKICYLQNLGVTAANHCLIPINHPLVNHGEEPGPGGQRHQVHRLSPDASIWTPSSALGIGSGAARLTPPPQRLGTHNTSLALGPHQLSHAWSLLTSPVDPPPYRPLPCHRQIHHPWQQMLSIRTIAPTTNPIHWDYCPIGSFWHPLPPSVATLPQLPLHSLVRRWGRNRNDEPIPYVIVYWNRFEGSNLRVVVGVETQKGPQKLGEPSNLK